MDCHIWNPPVINIDLLNSFGITQTNEYADTAMYISLLLFFDIFLLESIQTERE